MPDVLSDLGAAPRGSVVRIVPKQPMDPNLPLTIAGRWMGPANTNGVLPAAGLEGQGANMALQDAGNYAIYVSLRRVLANLNTGYQFTFVVTLLDATAQRQLSPPPPKTVTLSLNAGEASAEVEFDILAY